MLRNLVVLSILIMGSIFSSCLTIANANQNQVQVKVDGETYNLNVGDIPGFKEYLEKLPVSQIELEKQKIRAWLPDTGEKDTLVVGTVCGIRTCDLSLLKKIPRINKWQGIELEKNVTYQESVISPDKQKIAVLTAKQISLENTSSSIKNNVHALKVDPSTKRLVKIQDASPKNVFNQSYSETFKNINFENNNKFTFEKLTLLPSIPPRPGWNASPPRWDFIKMEGRIGE